MMTQREHICIYIYNMIKVSLIEVRGGGGGGGRGGRDVKDKQRIPHGDVEKRRLADTTIIGYLLYLPSTFFIPRKTEPAPNARCFFPTKHTFLQAKTIYKPSKCPNLPLHCRRLWLRTPVAAPWNARRMGNVGPGVTLLALLASHGMGQLGMGFLLLTYELRLLWLHAAKSRSQDVSY